MEVPNKPKKYETIEYPDQKVENLEQKRAESRAVFETLSTKDQAKYNEAYGEFVQKAKELGFDRVEEYDIFFEDRKDSNGSFAYSHEGCNFVTIGRKFVSRSDKLSIKKTLFHELVGHCLSSKNLSKASCLNSLDTTGLSFDKYRTSRYFKINKERIQDIAEELDLHPERLSKIDIEIVDKFAEIVDAKDKLLAIHGLGKYYEDYPSLMKELQESFDGSKKIGNSLNEGVTDYLAINMTVENEDDFRILVERSAYESYILHFVDVGTHLIELDPANLQAWDDCLFDARFTGQPYKIIRFLKDKTGITITPKELFALDFSKILGKH